MMAGVGGGEVVIYKAEDLTSAGQVIPEWLV